MKNQTLQALVAIQKRIEDQRGIYTFAEVLESNKAEIEFLSDKFKLNMEEALFLAGSCMWTIERHSDVFGFNDLAITLDVSNFEILLYQKSLKSLVEKEFWIEIQHEYSQNYSSVKSAIELRSKKFALHFSFGEHLN